MLGETSRRATPSAYRSVAAPSAILYQVYLASFLDSNGDGIGDVPGLTSRLSHIADLGVNAIWVSPWYPSPWSDGGYDVADYYGVHPRFGTLSDLDNMIEEAHRHNLAVIADLVVNHTSSEHPWFRNALESSPGSPAREFYHFADGRGPEQSEPPNDWISAFGGPSWTRVCDSEGRLGQWYLHLFSTSQPDLNWSNPHVEREIHQVVRFWLGRGIDGFRIDAASALAKKPGLPDAGFAPNDAFDPESWTASPFWDFHQVHDVLKGLRNVCDESGRNVFLVGEVTTSTHAQFNNYLRPGELHSAFDRKFLQARWASTDFREAIDTHHRHYPNACWTLESHDEIRSATRLADEPSGHSGSRTTFIRPSATQNSGNGSAEPIGTRRARAAALLMLALPGPICIYQGQELGLTQVPTTDQTTAIAILSDPAEGRLGCRVPLPWGGGNPPFDFTSGPANPWLAQPEDWSTLTVALQSFESSSTFEVFRHAVKVRRSLSELNLSHLEFLEMSDPDVLAFLRSERFLCVTNFSSQSVKLDWTGEVLATSRVALSHGSHEANDTVLPIVLESDTTIWIYLKAGVSDVQVQAPGVAARRRR